MFKDSEYYKLERPRLLSPKAYSSTSQSCSLRLHHISTRSCHHDGATDVLLWKSHRDTNGPGGVLMPMSLRPRIKFWTRRYPPPSGAPKLEHGSGGSSHSLSEGGGGRAGEELGESGTQLPVGAAKNRGTRLPCPEWPGCTRLADTAPNLHEDKLQGQASSCRPAGASVRWGSQGHWHRQGWSWW
jgi:hypothetical protein